MSENSLGIYRSRIVASNQWWMWYAKFSATMWLLSLLGGADDNLDDMGSNLILIEKVFTWDVLKVYRYISNIFGSYYEGFVASSQRWRQFAMFSATMWPISFFSWHSFLAGIAGHHCYTRCRQDSRHLPLIEIIIFYFRANYSIILWLILHREISCQRS